MVVDSCQSPRQESASEEGRSAPGAAAAAALAKVQQIAKQINEKKTTSDNTCPIDDYPLTNPYAIQEPPNKLANISPISSDHITKDMNVPINLCGLIIGKQGETIKKLQADTGVKIELIQDSPEKTAAFKPLRFTGYHDKVQSAIEIVKTYLINHGDIKLMSSILSAEPGLLTEHVKVPKLAVGAIIGRSGETIRNIALLSGAKVQFDKEELKQDSSKLNPSGEKTCIIVGTSEAVESAKLKIIEIINQAVRLNQPSVVPKVGKEIQTEFPIPFDKIGMVIGKSGATIREINALTGAHAKISEDPPDDNNQKKFIIRGGSENVKKCILLLCEKAGISSPMNNNYNNMMMTNPLMALAMMSQINNPSSMMQPYTTQATIPTMTNPLETPFSHINNTSDPNSYVMVPPSYSSSTSLNPSNHQMSYSATTSAICNDQINSSNDPSSSIDFSKYSTSFTSVPYLSNQNQIPESTANSYNHSKDKSQVSIDDSYNNSNSSSTCHTNNANNDNHDIGYKSQIEYKNASSNVNNVSEESKNC